MTTNQMSTLQMNWRRRADRAPCEHSNLELEWNEQGHATGYLRVFSAVNLWRSVLAA